MSQNKPAILEASTDKVILYGVNFYSECGYTVANEIFLATFGSKEQAEEYVLESIKEILPKYDQYHDLYEFKENSLLNSFSSFEISPYQFPHNPKL